LAKKSEHKENTSCKTLGEEKQRAKKRTLVLWNWSNGGGGPGNVEKSNKNMKKNSKLILREGGQTQKVFSKGKRL